MTQFLAFVAVCKDPPGSVGLSLADYVAAVFKFKYFLILLVSAEFE